MKIRRTKSGIVHKFYFVRPKENANAGELAEKLLGLRSVEEVFVTDGDCGFIVKARLTNNREPKEVAAYISKNIGSRYGRVMSYLEYRK